MPRFTCPKDKSHTTFLTSAIERHDWEVDEEGNFKKDLGCYDSKLNDGCEVTCKTCGTYIGEA